MTEKINIDEPLSMEYQNVYYVYQAFVDGELKYIGKGKGKRLEHCTSGRSSCSELNRDFHAGKEIVVVKYKDKLLESEAHMLEMSLIEENASKGIYNKRMDYDLSSKPNLERMKDVNILAKDLDKKLVKHICKLSPEITKHSFRKFRNLLNDCGLMLYLTEVKGSAPILVIDKIKCSDYEVRHWGCPNYPNCDVDGCGKDLY